MSERSSEQWIVDLRQSSPVRDKALADLRAALVRGLGYALAGRSGVDEALLQDFAQEALLKILANLNSFREASRFTSWAQKEVIAEELTDKQRQALIAVRVHGMPLEEVARWMGTNRNAMYKLLHDARQRLKKRLLEQGLSAQEILAAFE